MAARRGRLIADWAAIALIDGARTRPNEPAFNVDVPYVRSADRYFVLTSAKTPKCDNYFAITGILLNSFAR